MSEDNAPASDHDEADGATVEPAEVTTSNDEPATNSADDKSAAGGKSPWLVTAVVTVVAVVAAVLAGVFLVQSRSAKSDLHAMQQTQDDEQHAKNVATDYANRSAAIDYKNIDVWIASTKQGASPDFQKQLATYSDALKALLTQLQWVSTGVPQGAVAKKEDNGTYTVQVFVKVNTSNVQSPGGVSAVATYPVTIDPKQDWTVTSMSSDFLPGGTGGK